MRSASRGLVAIGIAAVLAGCGSRRSAPAGDATSDPPAPAPAGWLDGLPALDVGNVELSIDDAVVVGIDARGAVRVGPRPSTSTPDPAGPGPLAAAQEVALADLGAALARLDPALDPTTVGPGGGSGIVEHPSRVGHHGDVTGAPRPPRRLSEVFGATSGIALVPRRSVVVLADADAPATVLIDVLAQAGGVVAVRGNGELRALPVEFSVRARQLDADRSWNEVRLGATIDFESVPSAPVVVADPGAAAAAYAARPFGGSDAVDVLVSPEIDVQTLVATVAALRAAGAAEIGLGRAPGPGSDEALARGDQGARVVAGELSITGGLPSDLVRPALADAYAAMRACYQAALVRAPSLQGAGELRVVVSADGEPTRIRFSGAPHPVPRELVACATSSIASMRFDPRPDIAVIEQRLYFLR